MTAEWARSSGRGGQTGRSLPQKVRRFRLHLLTDWEFFSHNGSKMLKCINKPIFTRKYECLLRPLSVLWWLHDLWPSLRRFALASNPPRLALSSSTHAWSCTETPANWHSCQYSVLCPSSWLPRCTQMSTAEEEDAAAPVSLNWCQKTILKMLSRTYEPHRCNLNSWQVMSSISFDVKPHQWLDDNIHITHCSDDRNLFVVSFDFRSSGAVQDWVSAGWTW